MDGLGQEAADLILRELKKVRDKLEEQLKANKEGIKRIVDRVMEVLDKKGIKARTVTTSSRN